MAEMIAFTSSMVVPTRVRYSRIGIPSPRPSLSLFHAVHEDAALSTRHSKSESVFRYRRNFFPAIDPCLIEQFDCSTLIDANPRLEIGNPEPVADFIETLPDRVQLFSGQRNFDVPISEPNDIHETHLFSVQEVANIRGATSRPKNRRKLRIGRVDED